MKVPHLPPPNDQKEDPEFNWGGIRIKGGSQCQGNSNQDLIHSIGLEFNIKAFTGWTTKDYYIHFYAYMTSRKPPVRSELMDYRNHAWYINELFEDFKIPIIAKDQSIPNKAFIIEKAIEQTNRPVSVGTMLSSSGHWISIHGYENRLFNCNDPYGQHPYKKDQKGGYVNYSYDYLQKHVVRRLITLEDK
jgi:hypothetical protein